MEYVRQYCPKVIVFLAVIIAVVDVPVWGASPKSLQRRRSIGNVGDRRVRLLYSPPVTVCHGGRRCEYTQEWSNRFSKYDERGMGIVVNEYAGNCSYLPNMSTASVMDIRWKKLLQQGNGGSKEIFYARLRDMLRRQCQAYQQKEIAAYQGKDAVQHLITTTGVILEEMIQPFELTNVPLFTKIDLYDSAVLYAKTMHRHPCICCGKKYHITFVKASQFEYDFQVVCNRYWSLYSIVCCPQKFTGRKDTWYYAPNIAMSIAHEMAHIATLHCISCCKIDGQQHPEIFLQRKRNNEFNADLIACLMLRDEEYLRSWVLAHVEHYQKSDTTRTPKGTHPSAQERIELALTIWAASLIHGKGESYHSAINTVASTVSADIQECVAKGIYDGQGKDMHNIPLIWKAKQESRRWLLGVLQHRSHYSSHVLDIVQAYLA